MKIKSTWNITDKQVDETKIEFSWNTTLGEIWELSRIILFIEGFTDNSKDRNIVKEFGKRLRDIYKTSATKLRDTNVEVEIDPNPNAIKL